MVVRPCSIGLIDFEGLPLRKRYCTPPAKICGFTVQKEVGVQLETMPLTDICDITEDLMLSCLRHKLLSKVCLLPARNRLTFVSTQHNALQESRWSKRDRNSNRIYDDSEPGSNCGYCADRRNILSGLFRKSATYFF